MAASILPGTVIAFSGALGAGKTTFIQGLAHGLGVHLIEEVLSPTYALMHIHEGSGLKLVHIDFYRCHDEDELESLGLLEEIGAPQNVCAIEWAERFSEVLGETPTIHIDWDEGVGRIVQVCGLEFPTNSSLKPLIKPCILA